jgi:PAS domain S-box-containing protein
MSDQRLTKAQLTAELDTLRRRVADLEAANARLTQAEKDLRRSETSLAEAQRVARLGNWEWNVETNELWWSDEIYRIFGLTPRQFGATYEAFLATVHPEDRDAVMLAVDKALNEREPYSIHHRIVLPDRSERIVHERAEVTYNEGGTPVRMLGTVQDVTERRRTEETLRLEEERLKASLELSGMENVSEGEIVGFALEEAVKLTRSKIGYLHLVSDDQQGLHLLRWSGDVMKECSAAKPADYPLDRAGVWADSIRRRESVIHNDYQSMPDRKEYPEGHVAVERHMSVPILDAGKVVAVIGVSNKSAPYDQSDARQLSLFIGHMWEFVRRRRAEEEVRRSEANYRVLVDHATYGIYRSTEDDRFLTVNPALAEMLGYESEAELMAVKPSDLYGSPAERDRYIEQYRDAERIVGAEVQWKRKDGARVTVRLSGRRLHAHEGEPESYEMIAEDITDQRKLEAQLRQAQKMEAVGQLTGGIAHDFNNVLTVIISNADFVAASLPEEAEEARTDLGELRGAALRGAEMIKKLLGFSRRGTLAFESVDLRQLVADTTRVLRRLLEEHIAIDISVDEPVDAVRADPGAVEQILLNLATNARDAMPDGGTLRIDVCPSRLDAGYHATHPWVVPGDYVCITVSDTGVGMDEETKKQIFEPFFTTKPGGEGTGLGMAMIYGLVKQHGGYVHIYSELGKGTTVKVYFPTSREEVEAAAREPVSREVHGGTEMILVVEDEPAIRRATRRALESHGYAVLTAADGEEALEVFDAHESEIDLVISDLVMPKLGGRQLYDAVRGKGSTVKFSFMSGHSADEVHESTTFELGTPVLEKPWTLDRLLEQVRDVLHD